MECRGFGQGKRLEVDCVSAVCFPVVAIVDEEVGNFAEGFKGDSVVKWHGGGDNWWGIMSVGGVVGGFMWEGFPFCDDDLCVVWQLVSYSVCGHFFSCAR